MDFYLSKIKEKLQQITDRVYDAYIAKLDLFKAEYGA